MSKKKSGIKTFVLAIIMSAPTPLVVGVGLLFGKSSTQIADLVCKTAEVFAILTSFVVYLITQNTAKCSEERAQRLERRSNSFVGLTMCFAGIVMLVLAFFITPDDKGNVLPALIISVYGAVVNFLFWVRYKRLNRAEPNGILAVQVRLYRAKTLVDVSVAIALLSVLIAPQSVVSYWFDFFGTLIVAVYLIWSGIRTIYKQVKYVNEKE
ncbi:MAG: cation transporter [Clostridia bacterium]|nr:cation transporter [Clostridia bacterium]